MSNARLDSYGCNIKRVADAHAREEQHGIIRRSRFKASLVEDPLRPAPDLVKAIETARKQPR